MALFDTFTNKKRGPATRSLPGPLIDIGAMSPAEVYATKEQQEHARKMSEELLKRKPDIKHWTQGAAYLLDTLAGIQYQNVAGREADKTARGGKGIEDSQGADTGSTASIPPPAAPEAPQPTADQPPLAADQQAKLEALRGEAPPESLSTGDILKTMPKPAGPEAAAPAAPESNVPTPPPPPGISKLGGPVADAAPAKKNPFDLRDKVKLPPEVKPDEGWTPVIQPYINEKAPYMKRSRDMSKVNSLVFHHDMSYNTKQTDVENAQRLARYGQKVDPVRKFDPGYHYYIARDGSIIQGAPDDKRTHHVKNGKNGVTNDTAMGVVLMGSDDRKNKPTEAQLKAARFLGDKLMKDYKISPNRIYGHGEVNPGHRDSEEGMNAVRLFRNQDQGKPGTAVAQQGKPVPKPTLVSEGRIPEPQQPQQPEDLAQTISNFAQGVTPQGVRDFMQNLPGPDPSSMPPPEQAVQNMPFDKATLGQLPADPRELMKPMGSPNDPMAAAPGMMGLGGPKPPVDEQQLVQLAQAGGQPPAARPPTARPIGNQPAVAQPPIAPVPAMTPEQLYYMNRGGLDNVGANLERYRKSFEPTQKPLDKYGQTIAPATTKRPAQFQTDLPAEGTAADGLKTRSEYDPQTGEYRYRAGGPIGPVKGMMQGVNPGNVGFGAPTAQPAPKLSEQEQHKADMDALTELRTDVERTKAPAEAVKKSTEMANEMFANDTKLGESALKRTRDWDIINSTIGIYGKGIQSTRLHQVEGDIKQFAARYLGLGSADIEKLTAAGELQGKVLNKTIAEADASLAGHGSNLRLSKIEQANPNMANSTEGKKLIVGLARQADELNHKLALHMAEIGEGRRVKNYLKEKSDFMAMNPISVDLDGKKIFAGNWQNMDQVRATVPIGAYWVKPNGKIQRRTE